jgi:stage II sporulation protein D
MKVDQSLVGKRLVRIGLTVPGLLNFERNSARLCADGPIRLYSFSEDKVHDLSQNEPGQIFSCSAARPLVVRAAGDQVLIDGTVAHSLTLRKWLAVQPVSDSVTLNLEESPGHWRAYKGILLIRAESGNVRLILQCGLDDYVRGVLGGEMPASYHLEAIKAQAVAARTYALNPRLNHEKDFCQVCDSFLCCQCFDGAVNAASTKHLAAISGTSSEVLFDQGEPILALFSACAGGQTESYENCFSNLENGSFPDKSRPYLKSVSERINGTSINREVSERALRVFWDDPAPATFDDWSKHFRWRLEFSAGMLESIMHYVIEAMLNDPVQAPFIVAPPGSVFGHIQAFEVTKRGRAGTAMVMSVHTSKGEWQFYKEIVIRNLFKNPDLNLKRLGSARVLFEHKYNALGLLDKLVVYGLGWGHGVGLQQDGAEGMARRNRSYREILAHYYQGATLEKI